MNRLNRLNSMSAPAANLPSSRPLTRLLALLRHLHIGLLLGLGALSTPTFAADFSFTGNLPNDNSVLLFSFTIAAPGNVTVRTYSYAGGTNADSATIPAGGFDPILSVFDSSGALVDDNDDDDTGTVAADPVSGEEWDTYLEMTALPAGQYTVAVSQYANFAIGPNLSNGFEGSDTSGFVDDEGFTRTSAWAFDVLNADSAELSDTITGGSSAVQVPMLSEWMLMVLALLLATVAGVWMRLRSA